MLFAGVWYSSYGKVNLLNLIDLFRYYISLLVSGLPSYDIWNTYLQNCNRQIFYCGQDVGIRLEASVHLFDARV